MVAVAHRGGAGAPEWLAFAQLVLGAATNAVFVWSRFFAQALLHARPGSGRLTWLRLGVLNVGVAAVLTGMGSDLTRWPQLAPRMWRARRSRMWPFWW